MQIIIHTCDCFASGTLCVIVGIMLQLPRPYLSHSAKALWKSNREGFRNKYYRPGGPQSSSPEMDFGKDIAKQLETLEITNPILKGFIDDGKLPVYPVRELKIEVTVEGVPLLGYLDMFHPDTLAFRDQKTGHSKWTSEIVNKHPQLPFYAILIHATRGSVAEVCHLDWMQTEMVDEFDSLKINGKEYSVPCSVPRFTGHIESFERVITPLDRFAELQDIVQCAHEVSADYQNYLKNK